jgi:hypothetical protein
MRSSGARLLRRASGACRGVYPFGLFGMVALIVGAECAHAPRGRMVDPVGRVKLSWSESMTAADGPQARAQVLCLGDSLIKLGILPRVLEARTGVSAYNLAVLGGQAPSSFFLLRRVLEQGLRPRALLVDFSEDLLSLAPGQNPTCWADSLGARQSMDLAWRSCDPTLAISTGLHWLLPHWCDQNHVQAALGLGVDRTTADDPRVFERNWQFNRGAQVAPRIFVPVEGFSSGTGERWRPQAANAFYVDRLLRTADAGKILVFWILTPSVSGRLKQSEQTGVHAAYRQFIDAQIAAHPCLTVLDGQRLFKDKGAFRDPIHVNRDGAIGLSVAVGTAIAPRLYGDRPAARWIELLETGDQETSKYQKLVEDLDQSRGAVRPIGEDQSSRKVALW